MRRKSVIGAAGLVALLGAATALLTACGSGISEADYDAVKQKLGASEQEAAAAKQQVASLQEQLKPAAAREPKRLEAKLTIEMNEGSNEMFFTTPEGAKGGPFRLPSGKTVGFHFVNKGKDKHEFFFGRTLKTVDGKADGYEVNLFEKVTGDVFVYANGKMVEIGGAEFEEVEVEPGAEVWIRAKFPTELKGEWQIGCFVQEPDKKGHYEQGMKATLIID
jgi:uncharacterized cupredoxin-like copper-binding protein